MSSPVNISIVTDDAVNYAITPPVAPSSDTDWIKNADVDYDPLDPGVRLAIRDVFNGVVAPEIYDMNYAPFDMVVDMGYDSDTKKAMMGLVEKRNDTIGLINLSTDIRSPEDLSNSVASAGQYMQEDIFIFGQNKKVLDSSINSMVRLPVTTTVADMIQRWISSGMTTSLSDLPGGLATDLTKYNIRPRVIDSSLETALSINKINFFKMSDLGMRLNSEELSIKGTTSKMSLLFNKILVKRMIKDMLNYLEDKRHLLKNPSGGISDAMTQLETEGTEILNGLYGKHFESLAYHVFYEDAYNESNQIISHSISISPRGIRKTHVVEIKAIRI